MESPGAKMPGDSITLEGKMLSGQISTGTLARAPYSDADVYNDGYLYIEYDKFYVACNNRPLYHLGRMQMLVLFRLARAGGRPVARHKIWADVWGNEEYKAQTLRVCIAILRRKLAPYGLIIISPTRSEYCLARAASDPQKDAD
jgi:DNA-binding response OmpR family regulator